LDGDVLAINVAWENERGDVLERWSGCISGALVERAAPSTVCLRFIDPYGDTIFNRYQVPILVQELEALAQQVDVEDRETLRRLLAFLTPERQRVHEYVRFIGD
jgi:hypothetical protein